MPKNQKYTPSKPLVEVIEDVDFAQLLLVPAKTSLNIKRDPFEPLEQMGSELTTGQDTAAHFEVNYLGSIRIGDQISALLKTAEGKDVFKIGDAVSGFTIMEINEEHIVFQKEDKTITINKGAI